MPWTSKFACPARRKHHPAWNVRSIVASLIGCIQVGWVALWYFLAFTKNIQWAAGNPSLAGGMGVVQIALFQAGQAITRSQFCTHSFLLKSSGNTSLKWFKHRPYFISSSCIVFVKRVCKVLSHGPRLIKSFGSLHLTRFMPCLQCLDITFEELTSGARLVNLKKMTQSFRTSVTFRDSLWHTLAFFDYPSRVLLSFAKGVYDNLWIQSECSQCPCLMHEPGWSSRCGSIMQ